MISEEDRLLVLSAYTVGIITRFRAMELLEIDWYGDLLDQMDAAGLKIVLPDELRESMRKTLHEFFDVLAREPKEKSND